MQSKLKYAAAALILLGAGCSGGDAQDVADETNDSAGSTEVTVEIQESQEGEADETQPDETQQAAEQPQTEQSPKAPADENTSADTSNQNQSSNSTAQPMSEETNQGALRIINMTAKKWEFEPAVVRVNQGDQVRLIVESTDVTHGIFIKAFNVNEVLSPGKATTIEFTASNKGTFPMVCSVPCGSGHGSMTGSLIVE